MSGAYAEVCEGVCGGETATAKVLRTLKQESTAMLKKVSADYGRGGKHMEEAYSMMNSDLARRLLFEGHVVPICPQVQRLFYHNEVPAIIMPWMPHRNITEYLREHPEVNLLRLVSLNTPKCQRWAHP